MNLPSKPISRSKLNALAFGQPPNKPLALALETSGPDPLNDSILSVAWSDGSPEPSWFQVQDEADREALSRFLSQWTLILYDAARCSAFLRQAGITPNVLGDPKLGVFALNPIEPLDLKAVCARHLTLNIELPSPDPVESGILEGVASTLLAEPGSMLKGVANAIFYLHTRILNCLDWALNTYRSELEVFSLCTDMFLGGIRVSLPALQDKISVLEASIASQEAYLNAKAKELLPNGVQGKAKSVNWGSPSDVGEILSSVGVPLSNHTAGGKLSVRKDVLAQISDTHPLIPLILDYRHTVKLAGIARTLRKFYNEKTGAIHSEWLQTGVPTGRFRSRNPNLQQIPEVLRSVFVPRSDHYLIGLDYDQLEYRILAASAGETALVEAFLRGEDIHTKTASMLLGVLLGDIVPEQRAMGKQLGYSQLYGSGASGLAHKLNIPKKNAQALLNQYFAAVPKLVAFLETLRQRALSQGYVASYYGRRRPLPEIYSANPKIQAFGMRSAVNGYSQSTAADVAKQAMVRVDKVLKRFNAFMLVQLHDGLLLEVPEAVPLKEILPELKDAMETEILGLPLTVSASWGHNWHDLEKL